MTEVLLHYYDLSQGLSHKRSELMLGKYYEGIWHTGICAFD